MTEQPLCPYDPIAEQWNAARRKGRFDSKYVDLLLDRLVDGAEVLDVGCGAGIPIAEYLIDRGCDVTGIDASAAMLKLAKQQVPTARFVLCDLMQFEPTAQYSGIVAWDSIFHIPRNQHLEVFKKFNQWLIPNGLLLISLGGSAWEGTMDMFGHEFFCSGFEPDDSLKLLQEAGFEILLSEVDDPSSRGHIAVLCSKRSADMPG
jgi:cyclopropane fatty-acyl-phospholipid synthase-like methyltransferase